jgi:cationic peptide transport system substrate-binding protein
VRELPLLPLAHGMRFQASSADVEGIPLGPFGAISLANARKK